MRRFPVVRSGFLVLFLGLLLQAIPALADETRGRVSWIYDGDTLEVQGLGRVRLLGIDCPETEDSPRDRFYRERFGILSATLRQVARSALHFNINAVKGRIVTLTFEEERRDRHGRLLAYVVLPDGRMLNQVLLEKGLAAVYRKFDFSRKPDFLSIERQARQQHRGLWRNRDRRSKSQGASGLTFSRLPMPASTPV